MYESHYGFGEKPFSLLPDPGFLYLGHAHSSALTAFEYALMNGAGLAVLTGEIGCGKTTLIRQLLNQVDDELTVGLISNTHHDFGDLLQWVLLAFGLDYQAASKPELYERFIDFLINEYASGRRTVLIVDEAQNMSPTALEDLRLLLNINADKDLLLQVFLVGQPELRQKLRAPELAQFVNRVGITYHLEALDETETREYIGHRLEVAGGNRETIESEACAAIAKYTGGVPRLVNLVCDSALSYAFGEKVSRVNAEIVESVVRDGIVSGNLRGPAEGAGWNSKGSANAHSADPLNGSGIATVFPVVAATRLEEWDDFDITPGSSRSAAAQTTRVAAQQDPVAVEAIPSSSTEAAPTAVELLAEDEALLEPVESGVDATPEGGTEHRMLRQLFGGLRERKG